ncbi:MAG: cyclopropane-fatty-acyl-phospholipid synthase [Thermoleophilaceae bacterium]|jgi:cyclopropane-fatty-acyl-phospholipid synthase|nr:cyclopropane-fatty-acyl-phospholipid synthase [Thermoleophilaceae bacterium]
MFARVLSTTALNLLREGHVEVADARRRRTFGPPDAPLAARVRLHDERFWRAFPRGSLPLAETYADGAWDCDDLVALVRIGTRELPRVDRWRRPLAPLQRALSTVPRNTRSAARRHIAAHYDLGNPCSGSSSTRR